MLDKIMRIGNIKGGQRVYDARKALGMSVSDAPNEALKETLEPFNITEAVEQAVIEKVNNGPARAVVPVNSYSVAAHLETIAGLVEKLEARRVKLTDEQRFEREEFDASQARKAGEIDEVERLLSFYKQAETLTLPRCRVVKPVPVDPAAMDAVGDKIAATKRRNAFEVPDGFEAVLDAEGRATGEIQPVVPVDEPLVINPTPARRRRVKPIENAK